MIHIQKIGDPLVMDARNLGLFSIIAGLVVLLLPGGYSTFVVGSLSLTCIALTLIVSVLREPKSLDVWLGFAFSLAFAYGVGSTNTLIGAIFSPISIDYLFAASDIFCRAIGHISIIIGLLLLVHKFDQTSLPLLTSVDFDDFQVVLVLGVCSALASWLLLASGSIGYQGSIKASSGAQYSINPLAATALSAIVPVSALCCFAAVRTEGRQRHIFVLLAAIQMLILVTQGRRLLVFGMFVCYLAAISSGLRIKMSGARLLLILPAFVLVIGGATTFFYAMRFATFELPEGASVLQIAQGAIEKLSVDDESGFYEDLQDNVRTRSLIVSYLAVLIDRVDIYGGVNGDVLTLAVAQSIPSLLLPSKSKYLALGGEEDVVHPHLGLPLTDEANTILTSGVSDFGVIGMYIYTICLALIFRAVRSVSSGFKGVAYVVCGYTLLIQIISTESNLASAFVAIRNSMILALLCFAFQWVTRHLRR